MKIDASQLELHSCHSLSARREQVSEHVSGFAATLRDADAALGADAATATITPAETAPAGEAVDAESRIRLLLAQLIDAILTLLSGDKKCRCRVDELADLKQGLPGRADGRDGASLAANRAVFTWERRTVEHVAESERTDVGARGRVRTADGREIEFSLGLAMCRDFSRSQVSVERGRIEFKDPLVLNFDGRATELADTCFSFDLDADGQADVLQPRQPGFADLAADILQFLLKGGFLDMRQEQKKLIPAIANDGVRPANAVAHHANGGFQHLIACLMPIRFVACLEAVHVQDGNASFHAAIF